MQHQINKIKTCLKEYKAETPVSQIVIKTIFHEAPFTIG